MIEMQSCKTCGHRGEVAPKEYSDKYKDHIVLCTNRYCFYHEEETPLDVWNQVPLDEDSLPKSGLKIPMPKVKVKEIVMADEAKCPYCNKMNTNLVDLFCDPEGGEHATPDECEHCHNGFTVKVHVTKSYSIEPINEKEE